MFRVRWRHPALEQLAAIWIDGDSALRHAITQSTQRIDQQLRRDPLNTGESRPGDRRIYFEPPLGVLFRVYPDRSLVRVLRVWSF